MKTDEKNPPLGSLFDDFLDADGMLEEVTEGAAKRVLARSLAAMIERSGKTKTRIAREMGSSRSQVNRLLDETDMGVTLHTIMSAARAAGGRVRITIEPVD
ncbi:MAG: XRE family transcriptional regulator [Rhodospirillales bacterium]|nr:XRE family transcriptional regulator [Rhodospirillales bacterium]